ncbi:hypothetical protein IKD98_03445, partial [Candidatus Saccharibacteria bacterium]|nr:hypothetical protein [Candidatus Saccharibacteria bacterium]
YAGSRYLYGARNYNMPSRFLLELGYNPYGSSGYRDSDGDGMMDFDDDGLGLGGSEDFNGFRDENGDGFNDFGESGFDPFPDDGPVFY